LQQVSRSSMCSVDSRLHFQADHEIHQVQGLVHTTRHTLLCCKYHQSTATYMECLPVNNHRPNYKHPFPSHIALYMMVQGLTHRHRVASAWIRQVCTQRWWWHHGWCRCGWPCGQAGFIVIWTAFIELNTQWVTLTGIVCVVPKCFMARFFYTCVRALTWSDKTTLK
jgi:hypothetical protein